MELFFKTTVVFVSPMTLEEWRNINHKPMNPFENPYEEGYLAEELSNGNKFWVYKEEFNKTFKKVENFS